MRKLSLTLLIFVFAIGVFVTSSRAFERPDRPKRPDSTNRPAFSLPANARKISENVYDLGERLVNGELVQGRAFVHYTEALAKREARSHTTSSSCYTYLSSYTRWKVTEPYVLDELGSGMDATTVASLTQTSLDTWDNQVAFKIFGSRDTASLVDGADTETPDNKNEIYFADVSDPGVIGVTIVWGYFSGPRSQRRIIEYDMVYDNVDFTWGDGSVDPSVMDYQNIVTHEIGHGAGMGDLYQSYCAEQTMYGYATEGETKKRDLNTGDVNGIKKLYR